MQPEDDYDPPDERESEDDDWLFAERHKRPVPKRMIFYGFGRFAPIPITDDE